MGKIMLEGMEFYAYHGVYAEEQKIGGTYRVDLSIEFNFDKALTSDNISETIDYGSIYAIIEAEMKKTSKLIEHLASRIVNRILNEFIEIKSIEIKLSKLNPPVKARMNAVSVVIKKDRIP
jgi:7,8-dihydroneopterin aldolase/epimerase/oxygenase